MSPRGGAVVLRGDATRLPLPDASVDLIVTSPPYWGLRSYTDGGAHYDGQIGAEPDPGEYLAALWACTREWIRVLKPAGSLFVNLGDKYSGTGSGPAGTTSSLHNPHRALSAERLPLGRPARGPDKCLLGLPWRYALGCTDQLGLILRAEIIWDKPNGLPESVTDRVRRAHEQVFHLVKQPAYYASVDEIRQPHHSGRAGLTWAGRKARGEPMRHGDTGGASLGAPSTKAGHPLGRLPGSVWEIPSAPLAVPAHLGIDHFAAYPPELCRRIILGWSPPAICTRCGEGRRPVADKRYVKAAGGTTGFSKDAREPSGRQNGTGMSGKPALDAVVSIAGYACACTPFTDHPGTGTPTRRRGYNPGQGSSPQGTYGRHQAGEYERTGPWRAYHLDGWDAPPSRPAVVADPFGGTGTTALTAAALGRTGITIDRSADYCCLARWRTTDPGERARALGVPKPPPVPSGQDTLFDLEAS